MIDNVKSKGEIQVDIEHLDGNKETFFYKNAIVRTAKEAHVLGIVNQIGSSWDFYVEKMLFGTNGTSGGTPKLVEETRNGLFGTTLLSKKVTSIVNPNVSTQAIFTTVLTYSEGNGNTINEMALQMKNDDLYSMVTMAGISKTSSMQITFTWRISMV